MGGRILLPSRGAARKEREESDMETPRDAGEGCWAAADLPPGAIAPDITVHAVTSTSKPPQQTYLKLGENGRLEWDSESCPFKWIRLSDDCHTCNSILSRGIGQGTLGLRMIRHVRAGEEIQMWFSEEILAAMDIPFLNPINIRGEKAYVCHRCKKKFEFPNPLKVHLALDCGERPRSELWKRLAECGAGDWKNGACGTAEPPAKFSFSLGRKSAKPTEAQPTPLAVTPQHSAFRPYLPPQPPHDLIDKEAYLNRQAAEIETLVSNMGQSKQGHLCLYCGKLYSRKYGLKIHIRTHTGFKPLKCKYCFRPFGDPSNLNKHVRLHSESETPYRCDLCGKMLVRRRDLERHIKSRHQMESAIVIS